MAEIVGLLASVSTLNDCLHSLIGFLNAFRNAPETLERYCKVLKSIQESSAFVGRLADESNLVRDIRVKVDGNEMTLIKHYSENVNDILKDAQQLVQRFQAAQSQSIKSFVERIKDYFKRASASLDLIYNEDHIKDLIRAAKDIESSQHMALMTALTVYHQVDTQGALKQIIENMITLSESSKDIQEICRRKKTAVVYFRDPLIARQKNALRGLASKRSSMKTFITGSQSRPAQRQDSRGDESDVQGDSVVISGDDVNGGRSMRNHDVLAGKDIAILRNDGGVDLLRDSLYDEEEFVSNDQASSSKERPHPAFQKADIELHSTLDYDSLSEVGSEDWPFSETEDFETLPVTGYSTPRLTGATHDSMLMDIEQDAMVFLDQSVVLNNCESSAAVGFCFCAKTLIVLDGGSASLVLQEPCNTPCEHISLLARNFIHAEQELPYTLRVSLRHAPTLPSDTNDISDQEPLTLTVIQAGFGRRLRTLVLSNQGSSMQHSIRTPLEVTSVLDDDFNEEGEAESATESVESSGTIPGHGTSSEPPINSNKQAAEEDAGVSNEETTNFGLMGFSRVPCFFCGEDALRPLLDGRGGWGFLVYNNESFGYSCDQCKERTWVSAGRFGLSGIGGTTAWGARRK